MAVTYKLIQTITVGSGGAASIEFGSIPQTYTDLMVKLSHRSTRSAANNDAIRIRFNGSTTGFTASRLYGTGSAASSDTSEFIYNAASNTTASVFDNGECYIPNYTSSNNKPFFVDNVMENNATLAYSTFLAGLWSNSSAITTIKIELESGPLFAQYSSASLYGIKNS